jgi:hydroxymethylglutaryl-CoA reductase
VTRLRRALNDPFTVSVAVLGFLAAAGLAGIAIGWRGAAASLVVSVQLPYIVSGVIGGVALLGFSLGLLLVQARRRQEARRRNDFDRVVQAAAALLAAVRGASA